jgi:uncharacterized protein (DUF1501 family)
LTHDRRFFLKSSGLALVGLGIAPGFLRRALASTDAGRKKVLVTIFQRGAVDGLSMFPPSSEVRYYDLRPSIAIARRGDDAALDLDGHFGLHPALRPLLTLWETRTLAVVHAAGSPDPTRSHFDAQDYLDAGTPGVKATGDGWLNRTLQARPGKGEAPFRAVAFQPNLPRSLAGREPALAVNALAEFGVRGGKNSDAVAGDFESLYAGAADGALKATGHEAFDSMKILAEANPSRFLPENGASYPPGPLGRHLREIAQLIRADVGLEIAATDCGGWDTHAGQGAGKGQLANRLADLGGALSAFTTDLGDRMADVCVVTMTEFGRTVRENGTRGTDHGHGSAMMVLGGGVRGGRVLARWKGLGDADLYEGRDLPVSTDHREVLTEILTNHMGIKDTSRVFPGFGSSGSPRVGLFS